MKRVLTLVAATVTWLVLGGAWTITALASAPHGTLTGGEYALLSSAEATFGTALHKAPVSWAGVSAACEAVGSSTRLLESERTSCLTETQLFEGLASFPHRESKCGTTAPRKEACMVPLYVGLAKDAKRLYQADGAENHVATQRGFAGRCFDALANSAKEMGQQREFVSAIEKLAADVQLEAKVAEGKLPSSAIHIAQLDSDVKAYERDLDLLLSQSGPKVSVCPHQ